MPILIVIVAISVSEYAQASLRQQVQALRGKSLTEVAAAFGIKRRDADGKTALHHSVILGDLQLTRNFLELGIDPLLKDRTGRYPYDYLVELAEDPQNPDNASHALIASYVLEKMPSRRDLGSGRRAGRGGIHQRDNKGWTPFVWAVIAKDKARINELLDAGVKVIDAGIDGTSTQQGIFKIAEIVGDQEIIDLLVDRLRSQDLNKALAEAYQFGVGPELISHLLTKHGNASNGWISSRKLHEIYYRNDPELFASALNVSHIRRINQTDPYGFTIAMRVAAKGNTDQLLLLKSKGALINSEVLLQALYSGNLETVEIVLKSTTGLATSLMSGIASGRIKPNSISFRKILETSEGEQIRQLVTQATNISEIQEFLRLENINDRNWFGAARVAEFLADDSVIKMLARRVPAGHLLTAYNEGLRKLARAMVDAGAEVNARKKFGKNITALAAERGHDDDLQFFVANGAEVDVKTISFVISSGVYHSVDRLLNHYRGDLGYRELFRWLTIASRDNNESLVEMLIERGVAAGLDRQTLLIGPAKFFGKLATHHLFHDHAESRAILDAVEEKNLEVFQGLGDYIPQIDDHSLKRLATELSRGDGETLEVLVNSQIISIDFDVRSLASARGMSTDLYNILLEAVYEKNLAVAQKFIALGGKVGVDRALIDIVDGTPISYQDRPSEAELIEDDRRRITWMKLLIDGGADLNWTFGSFKEESPLTLAIQRLRAPRVKFLLEQGAVAGDLKGALRRAKDKVTPDDRYYDPFQPQGTSHFNEIKKMLADRGLI